MTRDQMTGAIKLLNSMGVKGPARLEAIRAFVYAEYASKTIAEKVLSDLDSYTDWVAHKDD